MSDNLNLRNRLADIATDARPVDLYDRALRRSRQIHRRRTAGTSIAAAVAVLVLSALTWQLLPRSSGEPVQPSSPTPTVTVEPTIDGSAPSKVTLPQWPAPAEGVPFNCPTEGELSINSGAPNVLGASNVVALEVEGTTHYIGNFVCMAPDYRTVGMVLAYRADPDGMTLVDQIVDTTLLPGEGSSVSITDIRAGGTNQWLIVDLKMRRSSPANPPPGYDGHGYEPEYDLVRQLRTYRWDGSGYVQASGPASFRADQSVNLSVAPSDLVFGPEINSCRTGTMTLTVTNHGASAVGDIVVVLAVPGVWDSEMIIDACGSGSATQEFNSAEQRVGQLGPGETRAVTATVMVLTTYYGAANDAARFDAGGLFAEVRISGGAQWTGEQVAFTVQY